MIALPLPPSTNRLWRYSRANGRPYIDQRYATWKRTVGNEYTAHKREWPHVKGPFDLILTLPIERKTKLDSDNRIKAVLDAFQWLGMIENDKLLSDLRVRFGKTPDRRTVKVDLRPAAAAAEPEGA